VAVKALIFFVIFLAIFILPAFNPSGMFIDVCIPNGNEEEFILIAERLGTRGLLFLYEKEHKEKENGQRISSLQAKTKLKLFSGMLVKTNTNKPGITFAKAEQQNIENRNLRFMYDFEEQEEKDSFHYRRSGANQVLCTIMKEKEKVFVFDMEKMLVERTRDKLLGRMSQNLMLVRKYKLESIICSFATKPENLRAEKEYSSLIRALGYEEEAKKSTNNLWSLLQVEE
jgi:RNase P/RNase MRP subunit p30